MDDDRGGYGYGFDACCKWIGDHAPDWVVEGVGFEMDRRDRLDELKDELNVSYHWQCLKYERTVACLSLSLAIAFAVCVYLAVS